MSEPLICDVCRKNPALGVASSPFGAVSFAYCSECLNKPADPLSTFAYLYDFVGTDGDGLTESIQHWFTWKDEAYISWPDYVSYRYTFPLCEIHKSHQDTDGCSICGYEKAMENV